VRHQALPVGRQVHTLHGLNDADSHALVAQQDVCRSPLPALVSQCRVLPSSSPLKKVHHRVAGILPAKSLRPSRPRNLAAFEGIDPFATRGRDARDTFSRLLDSSRIFVACPYGCYETTLWNNTRPAGRTGVHRAGQARVERVDHSQHFQRLFPSATARRRGLLHGVQVCPAAVAPGEAFHAVGVSIWNTANTHSWRVWKIMACTAVPQTARGLGSTR